MSASLSYAAAPSPWLRGLGLLFWLYFSWRSVVLGCVIVGLGLLALTMMSWLFPGVAFPLALLSFVLLLGAPFLAAPPLLRTLIGHRSMSMVPRLPLLAGIALLLLTLLTTIFIPCVAVMMGVPGISGKFGVQLFIFCSLYIYVIQRLLVWRYGIQAFSLLPAAIVMVMVPFGGDVLRWINLDLVVLCLAAVTVMGWAWALWLLAHRSAFKPAHLNTYTTYTLGTASQGSLRFRGIDLARNASPHGSLLLAYPASLGMRMINIGNFVFLSPLLCTLLFAVTPYDGPVPRSQFLLNGYVTLTLFSGCISAYFYGEICARARLLWLRVGGGRSQLWRLVEQQVRINAGITAAVMLIAGSIGALFSSHTGLLHYSLLAVAFTVFEIYRSLCARVYCWPSLLRAVVLLLSLAALLAGLIFTMGPFGAEISNSSVLVMLEAGFVLLAVVVRQLARAGFHRIDWLVVKHEVSKRAMLSR